MVMNVPVERVRQLLVGVEGAREMLGMIDADTVRGLVRSGDIEAIVIASRPGVTGRKLRIIVSSVESYVERQRLALLDEQPEPAA